MSVTILVAFVIESSFVAVLLGLFLAAMVLWWRKLTVAASLLAIIAVELSAAVLLPNIIGARTACERNGCLANLRQIQGAKSTGIQSRAIPLRDSGSSSALCQPWFCRSRHPHWLAGTA